MAVIIIPVRVGIHYLCNRMIRAFNILLLVVLILSLSCQNEKPFTLQSFKDFQKQDSEPAVREESSSMSATNLRESQVLKREKKRNTGHKAGYTEGVINIYRPDSLIQDKLLFLRSKEADIDLNEPVSRSFFLSSLPAAEFPVMILLSRERFLKISFDNDIFDYTDRFYTNGIRFDLIAPFLSGNPVAKIMVPYWGAGTNYYGISLIQNIFTPSTTKVGGILYGDRPYAAYLLLGSFKITNDPVKRFRQTSEIDLGCIGPLSFGEWIQRSFHVVVPGNNEPLGWNYQIQNDLVINYLLRYEKGILSHPNLEMNLVSTASLGTLYTNITGGFHFRAGWMNPYFSNLGIARRQKLFTSGMRRTQFYFFLKGAGKLVGYDATLQGGLLNHSSVYTLSPDEISRLIFQSSVGMTFTYGGFQVDVEQFLLSPEFHHGWWHKWVHVGFTFCL